MFDREYRIPMDIMLSTQTKNTQCSAILEYEKKLKHMHEIARENMQTRTRKVATYYDRKIKDNILKKVFIFYLEL